MVSDKCHIDEKTTTLDGLPYKNNKKYKFHKCTVG